MTNECQALVLAAGKGTRLLSALPKVLHPVLGLPLLEYAVRAVERAGAAPIHVVVGHGAEQVQQAFAGRNLQFVLQDPPLGTGHAVQTALLQSTIDPHRTLLVVNADHPLLRSEALTRLLDEHGRTGAAATLLTAEITEPNSYGRVLRETDGSVRAIVEAKDASPEERAISEVNTGIYAFTMAALRQVIGALRPENVQKEYYLTDVIELMRGAGLSVRALATDDVDDATGVNTRADAAFAADRLRARLAESWMLRGVSIEDPRSTFIGPDVELDRDVVLRPFTLLEGRTRIGPGVHVGPFAHLVDTVVDERAQILDHCFLRECRVEAEASVGPFSHIRPESIVGARAKVGNFVELKKTHLGDGSKAPHLSYLGDATIGPGVNVGAGTITCNYDGHAKSPTVIGGGAFIGSNSTLVAPVTVGAGAYVAAGSAITEDVPANALALGRSRQTVKAEWASKRRQEQSAKTKPAHPTTNRKS